MHLDAFLTWIIYWSQNCWLWAPKISWLTVSLFLNRSEIRPQNIEVLSGEWCFWGHYGLAVPRKVSLITAVIEHRAGPCLSPLLFLRSSVTKLRSRGWAVKAVTFFPVSVKQHLDRFSGIQASIHSSTNNLIHSLDHLSTKLSIHPYIKKSLLRIYCYGFVYITALDFWKQAQRILTEPCSMFYVGQYHGDCSHEIKRRLLLGRKTMTSLDSILKSRDITLPTKVCLVTAMVFPVVMYGYELDSKESWALKNWCFWTVVLEETLENPLDCKEIQPVHSEGDQSWVFFGRTDAEAETPKLWPPDVKNWLIGNDTDAGKDWRQEKGMREDEMVGWHHWLDGHEFE